MKQNILIEIIDSMRAISLGGSQNGSGFTVEIAGEDWFRVRDPERVCVEVNGLRRAYQAIKERELELLLLRTGECDSTVSGLGQ